MGRARPGRNWQTREVPLPLPASPKHLDVALLVDEQVLGLEVPVDEVERMQVLEGEHDLGRVEARVGLAGESGDEG